MAVKFKYDQEQEQDRELIERRYASENKLLHAIAKGDPQMLKTAMEEGKELSWPYRHPNSPVRSMKNLSFSANTLFRKAAESGGVHPHRRELKGIPQPKRAKAHESPSPCCPETCGMRSQRHTWL
jgi:hypothetical protein